MSKPLEKDLNFSYTVEELMLLNGIYIDACLQNSYDEEWWCTHAEIGDEFIGDFLNWLSKEDRKELL